MLNYLIRFIREYKAYLILIILLSISLFLITSNPSGKLTLPRKISLYSFSVFNDVANIFSNSNNSSIYYNELREQNTELINELNSLRNSKQEIDELRLLLKFKNQNQTELIPAKVLYKSTVLSNNYFILDVGEIDGVVIDLPVFTPKGIVGIISQVSKNISVVKTIQNMDFKVSVVDSSKIHGIFKWDGNEFKVANIPKSAFLKELDVFYTSTYSSFFPNGIPVAKIEKITQGNEAAFYDISVIPTEDIHNVRNVFVFPFNKSFKELNLNFNID